MELGCFSCSEGDDGSHDVLFGTLFVLRLLFLVDNMEMTEIDVEYAC